MSIRTRLIALNLLLLVIGGSGIALMARYWGQTKDEYNVIIERDYHTYTDVARLRNAMNMAILEFKNVLLRGAQEADRIKYQAALNRVITEDLAETRAALLKAEWPTLPEVERFLQYARDQGEQEVPAVKDLGKLAREADGELTTLLEAYQNAIKAAGAGPAWDAAAGDTAAQGKDRAFMQHLDDLASILRVQAAARDAVADEESRAEMIWVSAIAGGLLLLVVALAFWQIATRVIRPLSVLTAASRAVAAGDASARIPFRSGDEIGQLAAGFNQVAEGLAAKAEMAKHLAQGHLDVKVPVLGDKDTLGQALSETITSLARLVGRIRDSAAVLTSSAQGLAETGKGVAQATNGVRERSASVAATAEELSANVSTVASSAEQMSANVNSVASAVEEMTSTITHISESAQKGATVAKAAQERSAEAVKIMQQLGAAAKDIGGVTEAIKHIAEQTNLLALNATIEAASAGDAGRGFAVVAGEIKALASQSSKAAEDIARRIAGVQQSTGAAVAGLEEIAKTVQVISQTSVETSAAVEQQRKAAGDIARNANEVNAGVGTIASSMTEAASGTTDIAKTIATVNEAAGGAKVDVDRMVTSAEGLTSMAQQLKQLVGQFRLDLQAGLVQYSAAYATGHPLVDEQHRQLFGMVNELHTAMLQERGPAVVKEMLDRLVDYTGKHFADEERLQVECRYPDHDKHRQIHKELVQQVLVLRKGLEQDGIATSLSLSNFLGEWLTKHIDGEDKRFIVYFKQHMKA